MRTDSYIRKNLYFVFTMKEFKEKSPVELEKLLAEKCEALRMFRFGTLDGKVKNVKLGRGIRVAIAQILTEVSSRKGK